MNSIALSHVFQLLEVLKGISSTNEKIAFLKAHEDSEDLKLTFFYALNPDLNYYIVPDNLIKVEGGIDGPAEGRGFGTSVPLSFFGWFSNREVTGYEARDKWVYAIQVLEPNSADVLTRIFNRDLRCGVAEGLVNKVWPGLIPEFNVMLADSYEGQNIEGWVAEAKYDGLRCIATVLPDGDVFFQSRNGRELYNMEDVAAEIKALALPSGTRLDGEIFDGDWNGTAELVRSSKTSKKSKTSVYYIFDYLSAPDWERPIQNYSARRTILEVMLKRATTPLQRVKVTESYGLVNAGNVAQIGATAIAAGYEGLVLKNPFANYEKKRSKAWLKVKPKETIDAVIVDVQEGTKKYTGKLGAFVCELPDGRRFNVGSGFSDDQRVDFWDRRGEFTGKTIEVEADALPERMKSKIIVRFPTFIRFRDDK
jgi:DNA ligase-1